MQFWTWNGSTDAERARITSGGNFGIANTDPNYNLSVGTPGSTAASYIQLGSTTTGTGSLFFGDTTGTGSGSFRGYVQYDHNIDALIFGSAATNRAVITSGGNFLINNTSTIASTLISKGTTSNNTASACHFMNSSDAALFFVRNDGYIETGTAASSPYNLTTGSAANMFVDSAGGLYRSTSSIRYKTDIQNAKHGLAEVLALRSVTYKGINDKDKVFGGLIAEEVHDIGLTEFVAYNNANEPDALHYGNMVALLTKAIQEQQAIITQLTARVAQLESK